MANSKVSRRKFSSERAKGYYELNDEEPTFTARYLGMTKVEDMFQPEKGNAISARCIDKLHVMPSKGKKRKVSLLISSNISRGLTVTEQGSKEELCYKLFDIAFCSQDLRNKMIFSFIAEHEDELQCHAFVFKTEERAKAMCKALSEAFATAHSEWMRKQKRKQSERGREEVTAGT
ncbi:low density lipoprotein receptor adapter protein 1-like [Oculina patagonica]